MLAVALPLCLIAPNSAFAQDKDQDQDQSTKVDEPSLRLKEIESRLNTEGARRQRLGALDRRLSSKLADLRRRMIGAARLVREREARLTQLEVQLRGLETQCAARIEDLARRRRQLAALAMAVRELASRPPEALLAATSSPVRTARAGMLLGSLIPGLRRSTEALRVELSGLAELRNRMENQRRQTTETGASLAVERTRLASLLLNKRSLHRKTSREREHLEARLRELAGSVRDLKSLVDELRRRDAAERQAVERLAAAIETPPEPSSQSALSPNAVAPGAVIEPSLPTSAPTSALTRPPAVADKDADRTFVASLPNAPSIIKNRGRLTYPASGKVIGRFGRTDRNGVSIKGISIRTRANAQVVAPFDGKVIYAGPFRGYGSIIIIEHGEGFHSLLMGLGRVDLRVGQGLLAGEPVGVMAASDIGAAKSAPSLGKSAPRVMPVLYLELRRDGRPIDPVPWLLARVNKVRG